MNLRFFRSDCAAAFIGVLPAALCGVAVMMLSGVAPLIWLQNLAAALLFALLLLLPRKARQALLSLPFAAVCVLFLFATLFFPGAQNVRRWVPLGPLNVYASALVLPAFLLCLSRIIKKNTPAACLLAAFASAILAAQSDLSQAAALLVCFAYLLFREKAFCKQAVLALLSMLLFTLVCFLRRQMLDPVDYCEGIVGMAGAISPILDAAAVIALLLLPVSFAFLGRRTTGRTSVSLYYTVLLLFALTGNYLVPIMGFGLSPIAGFWLAASLGRR